MKTITFGTLKGGVGKTMLCFNIGGLLESQGYRVLIVDSDLQGNLTNNIGIDRTGDNLFTLYEVYNVTTAPPPPETIVVHAPNERLPGLDIIPGSIFLHRAELGLSGVSGREFVLRAYMEEHILYFSQYDYILIDTNPSMSVINQNAFTISDAIVLISDVSMNALEGAQLFIALWEEASRRLRVPSNIKGFVVNDLDARNKLSADLLEYLQTGEDVADLRELLLKTIIPRNIRITESELAAVPIHLYDAGSKGSVAIAALVEEMKNRNIL